jgi:FkbM family methyltransferase
MNPLYHTRGFWRGLLRQPAWHLREWFRNPAYRALHRFHRQLRGVPRFTPAQVFFEGRPIRLCDAPSFLCAWDEIFVNRIYETCPATGRMPCLVDAGANVGLAALFWKWRYGEFRYLGFEPDPAVAACARENLRAWGIPGEIIEAAVGAQEGTAEFKPDGADGGRLVGEKGATARGSFAVKVRMLSRLLPAEVDLLKIDVEGAEGEVLADIAPCLPRIRSLFVEWHSRTSRPGFGAAVATLEAAGFDCYVQVAAGPSRPLLAAPSAGEFSQQVNVYAVRP